MYSLRSLAALFLLLCALPTYGQVRRGVTLNSTVTSEDIAALAPWKVNVVAYKLVWDESDVATEEQYFAWLSGALDKLETDLAALGTIGAKVIVNLYSLPGGFASRDTPALHRIFVEPWAQAAVVTAWQQIARRCLGNNAVFGFDLVNEPAQRQVAPGLYDWNALASQLAQAIRAIDPQRTIIVQPTYGTIERLSRLKVLKLKNVIYDVHFYYPWYFQHQGLYGIPINRPYPQKKFDRKALEKNLKTLIKFQKKHKVPIYIGEFSVVRWAPNGSAARYLRDVTALFDKYRWHWTYHAYREHHAWSLEHTADPLNEERSPTTSDRLQVLLSKFARNRF